MTKISTFTVLLSLTYLLSLFSGVQGQACGLCGSPGVYPAANRMSSKAPDGTGRDCLSVYIESAGLPPNLCAVQQSKNAAFCCAGASNNSGGSTGNGGSKQDGWTSPVGRGCHNQPAGNEGICMICKTDEFPGFGDTASIHARYYGDFTCAQYYDKGRNGQIPGFLCGQLQNFAERECGCGQYHPACNKDPQQCWNNLSSAEKEQRARPGCKATTRSTSDTGNNNDSGNNGNNGNAGWQAKTRKDQGRSSVRGGSGMGGQAGAGWGGRRVTEKDFTVTTKKLAETTEAVLEEELPLADAHEDEFRQETPKLRNNGVVSSRD